MDNKKVLVEVIQNHGIVYAKPGEEITLASGAKSKFYIDFDRLVMLPAGMHAIVDCLHDVLRKLDHNYAGHRVPSWDAFGGPSSGADPIVGAMMASLHLTNAITGKAVRGFKVRKEPKGRGPDAGAMIEGYLNPGDKAVLVEDVTTSGGSVLKAIAEVEKAGATVVKVITLLDRLAGAGEKLAKYEFEAITTLNDLKIEIPA